MEPWEVAIEKVKKLFAERKDPESWADNLIEASDGLTSKRDCFLFNCYITNPKGFDPNQEMVTLDDIVDLKSIPSYPEGMEVIEYKNGPYETLIHVKNVMNQTDDEKIEK